MLDNDNETQTDEYNCLIALDLLVQKNPVSFQPKSQSLTGCCTVSSLSSRRGCVILLFLVFANHTIILMIPSPQSFRVLLSFFYFLWPSFDLVVGIISFDSPILIEIRNFNFWIHLTVGTQILGM
jgi:hypothetical protein